MTGHDGESLAQRLHRLHEALAEDEARLTAVIERHDLDMTIEGGPEPLPRHPRLDDLLAVHGVSAVPFASFDLGSVRHALCQVELEELPNLDTALFAEWRSLDLPMMFLAGAVGAGLSALLRETFADLHDDRWQKLPWNRGGHGGEIIDRVPESGFGGGFGHRWRHGHDLLNPFEIEWENYPAALQDGAVLPSMARRLFYWFRHLLQDAFSREGLGLPGHSRFRDWLEPLVRTKAGRQTLQALGTIKARDLAGAGAANVIMGAYLWGTERDLGRVVVDANYRCFALMAGANLVTILCGLLVPPPATSLNWPAVPPLLYYGGRVLWLRRAIEQALEARNEVLSRRALSLAELASHIDRADADLARRAHALEVSAAYLEALQGQATILRQTMSFDEPREWSDRIEDWEAAESDEAQLEQITQTCTALFERTA